jgi:hypothetical protein
MARFHYEYAAHRVGVIDPRARLACNNSRVMLGGLFREGLCGQGLADFCFLLTFFQPQVLHVASNNQPTPPFQPNRT